MLVYPTLKPIALLFLSHRKIIDNPRHCPVDEIIKVVSHVLPSVQHKSPVYTVTAAFDISTRSRQATIAGCGSTITHPPSS
jgi:hypothetical protein